MHDSGDRVRRKVIAPLTNRHQAVLRLAVDTGQITVRQTAETLHVSRALAGGALRALERARYLDGQLIGGGEIGYTPTAQGRKRLDETARAPIAGKT